MSTTSTPAALPQFPLELELTLKIKVQTQDALDFLTSLDPVNSFKTDLKAMLEEEYGIELVECKKV